MDIFGRCIKDVYVLTQVGTIFDEFDWERTVYKGAKETEINIIIVGNTRFDTSAMTFGGFDATPVASTYSISSMSSSVRMAKSWILENPCASNQSRILPSRP
jgi:hypothetical protein